jgi:cytochrome c-type protein NapB
MKKTRVIVATLGILLVSFALGFQDAPDGTPDTEIGLSKESVFETPSPPEFQRNTSEPGDMPVIPRLFPEQPPVVPHGMFEFLPITMGENQCVDCHEAEKKIEGEATPIPQSHYVDLRNAPEVTGAEVTGARYLCVSCHVSPGNNPLLVGNVFAK